MQKFEYTQNVEAYLEDKQVFELLEGLLRKLIVHKPEDPYTFMMQRLQKPDRKHLHICLYESYEIAYNVTTFSYS